MFAVTPNYGNCQNCGVSTCTGECFSKTDTRREAKLHPNGGPVCEKCGSFECLNTCESKEAMLSCEKCGLHYECECPLLDEVIRPEDEVSAPVTAENEQDKMHISGEMQLASLEAANEAIKDLRAENRELTSTNDALRENTDKLADENKKLGDSKKELEGKVKSSKDGQVAALIVALLVLFGAIVIGAVFQERKSKLYDTISAQYKEIRELKAKHPRNLNFTYQKTLNAVEALEKKETELSQKLAELKKELGEKIEQKVSEVKTMIAYDDAKYKAGEIELSSLGWACIGLAFGGVALFVIFLFTDRRKFLLLPIAVIIVSIAVGVGRGYQEKLSSAKTFQPVEVLPNELVFPSEPF